MIFPLLSYVSGATVQIFLRKVFPIGNLKIEKRLSDDMQAALQNIKSVGDDFVVNDSTWFWKNPSGQAKPRVANSAKFITGRFQAKLRELGWSTDKSILDQEIDGYIEIEDTFALYRLDEQRFLELLKSYEELTGASAGPIATAIYQSYCLRASPGLNSSLAGLESFFTKSEEKTVLRCGVEFETGNVASSFRAATKLDYLFKEKAVDLGVFITSNDKANCAARIWPVSNRNGSLEELDRRNFSESVAIPLWEVGFAPDRFDKEAKYLSDDGTLYEMTPTGTQEKIGSTLYQRYVDQKGQAKFKPVV